MLDVLAALLAADVLVALHDAGTGHGAPQDALERHVRAHHGAVGLREDQVGGRAGEGFAQVRYELRRDGDGVGVHALGGVGGVRAGDLDQAGLEVHVALAEPEQLAAAHPRVDRRSKDRPPARRQRRQHLGDLGRGQKAGQPLRHLAPGDLGRGVRSAPLPGCLRPVEGRQDEPAQVVQALGRQVGRAGLQEDLDLPGGQVVEAGLPQLVPEQVLLHGRAVPVMRGAALRVRLEPPGEQVVHGAVVLLPGNLQAEPLSL
ncbi:MAG: hypothetical protein L6Q84_03610 [Polyangiaceae bacterium]|nr:hypothetical protein [Polyangiaceae bacterium]